MRGLIKNKVKCIFVYNCAQLDIIILEHLENIRQKLLKQGEILSIRRFECLLKLALIQKK